MWFVSFPRQFLRPVWSPPPRTLSQWGVLDSGPLCHAVGTSDQIRFPPRINTL